MKRLAVLLALVAAMMLPPSLHATPVPADDVHQQTMDDFLNALERYNYGSGSVSIFKEGREVYARRFGHKNLPGAAYDDDTMYPIGSVTTMVTAILAFKLIEAGRLSLDDRLSDFHPDMPSARDITIKQLLAHTSGLGNYPTKDGAVWVVEELSQQDILDEIKRQGTVFAPGENTAFSNSAYYLLRLILEQRYGRAYHEIVAEQIAVPLGLTHFASALDRPANVFRSHTYTEDWSEAKTMAEAIRWEEIKDVASINMIGVGDIVSTTADLNRLIIGLFQYTLLRKETLAQMVPAVGTGWGSGLAEFVYGTHRFLGYSGDMLGAHARVIYNPEDEIAIAYATTGEHVATDTMLEVIVRTVYDENDVYPQTR